jgi:prephenate dehydrogenase
MAEVGIIGYGSFGKFIAGILNRDFKVSVYDTKKQRLGKGMKFVSLKEAASKDIVVVAVNMEHFESVVKKISRDVKKDALVLDVCSVKVEPVRLMKKYLTCNVIATHPLFGPESGKRSIKGLKIVIWNVKGNKLGVVKKFLKQIGLVVLVKSPMQHDKEMAYVQVITHLVGRAVNEVNIPSLQFSTASYNKLKEMSTIVGKDSPGLFRTIQKYNKYATGVRKKFVRKIKELDKL